MGCRGRPVKKIKMTGAERMSLSCQRIKGELETVPRESEPQSNETGSRDIETVYEDERRVPQKLSCPGFEQFMDRSSCPKPVQKLF